MAILSLRKMPRTHLCILDRSTSDATRLPVARDCAPALSHHARPCRRRFRTTYSKACSTSARAIFFAICLLSTVLCHASQAIYIGTTTGTSGVYKIGRLSLDWKAEAHADQQLDVLGPRDSVDPLNNLDSDSSTSSSLTSPTTKTLSKLHTVTNDAIPSATTKYPPASTSSSSLSTNLTPLPQAFDASLGNNFTSSSCPRFFKTFLNDPAFTGCLPLSLLLLVNRKFFGVVELG